MDVSPRTATTATSSPDGAPAPPSEPQTPAASAAPSDAVEPPDRLRSALHVLGSVVAPTSLVTALLIYFGRQHARYLFGYFGVDLSLLGLTTQDYLVRSIDGFFVPVVVGLSAALVAQWLHARFSAQFFDGPDAREHLRRGAVVTGVVGLALFAVGMVRIVFGTPHSDSLVFPLSLGAGTLLILYASRLYRRAHPSRVVRQNLGGVALFEATGAFFLVGISLFWAVGNYSAGVGESRAIQISRTFTTTFPRATVYSRQPLHLRAAGVLETVCAPAGADPSFRYDGLRLLLRSGGHYFLLPDAWSPANGVAIVIRESDAVQLQFTMPAYAAPPPLPGGGGEC